MPWAVTFGTSFWTTRSRATHPTHVKPTSGRLVEHYSSIILPCPHFGAPKGGEHENLQCLRTPVPLQVRTSISAYRVPVYSHTLFCDSLMLPSDYEGCRIGIPVVLTRRGWVHHTARGANRQPEHERSGHKHACII